MNLGFMMKELVQFICEESNDIFDAYLDGEDLKSYKKEVVFEYDGNGNKTPEFNSFFQWVEDNNIDVGVCPSCCSDS